LNTYISGFFAVLLLSSFVKILLTLNILRLGIGLKGGGIGLALVGCSIALSLLVMSPHLEKLGGINEVLKQDNAEKIQESFRPFLEKNSNEDVKKKFLALHEKLREKTQSQARSEEGALNMNVLIPAFLISEMKDAFQIGFILLLPFLVVDLIVANGLMVLGITQMSPFMVSLPLKILLFFALDGWTLLSEKLVMGYL